MEYQPTFDDRRMLKDIETFYNTQIEEMPMNVACRPHLESSASGLAAYYYYNYYYYYYYCYYYYYDYY